MTLSELIKRAKELELQFGANMNVEFVTEDDYDITKHRFGVRADLLLREQIGESNVFYCTQTNKKYINIYISKPAT